MAQTSLNCGGSAYLFQGNPSSIYEVDLASGETSLLSSTFSNGSTINAIGYNLSDNNIWGYSKNHTQSIIRVNSNLELSIYPISGLPNKNFYVGDVSDEGVMFLHNSNTIHRINVNPNSDTYLTYLGSTSASFGSIHDFSYNPIDACIYTVERSNNSLVRFNTITNQVVNLGEVSSMSSNSDTYGATYIDEEGNLYVSANSSGVIYKINETQGIETDNSVIVSSIFAFGPSSSINDGAMCTETFVPVEICGNGVDDDNDGLIDCEDPSCADYLDCPDLDSDGINDSIDLDDDNDGILDTTEGTGDFDNDGVPNFQDLDSDNDGIMDVTEALGQDENQDGQADGTPNAYGINTSAGDGLTPPNTDNLGEPDYLDLDSDNDGISDLVEGGFDWISCDNDNNGVVNGDDTDNDGVLSTIDNEPSVFGTSNVNLPINSDGVDLPDYRDLDSDNDNLLDIREADLQTLDQNGDGMIDDTSDSDNDGIAQVVDNQPNDYGGAIARDNTLLPVVWLSFSALANDCQVYLKWETAMEEDNSHFEVEWSNDGLDFSVIGLVAGNGNSQAVNAYQFEHTMPSDGNNFYRLRQADFDGTTSLSSMISKQTDCNDNNNQNLRVYPTVLNVNNCTLNVILDNEVNQHPIFIYNPLGQLVRTFNLSPSAEPQLIVLDGLPVGHYTIGNNNDGYQRIIVTQ